MNAMNTNDSLLPCLSTTERHAGQPEERRHSGGRGARTAMAAFALLAAPALATGCIADEVGPTDLEPAADVQSALTSSTPEALVLKVNDNESVRFFVREGDDERISVTTALVGRDPGRASAVGAALARGATPLELWLAVSDAPAPIALEMHHQQLQAEGVVEAPRAPDLTTSSSPQANGGAGIDQEWDSAGCEYWAANIVSDHIDLGSWDGSYLSPTWTSGSSETLSLGTTERWITGACFVGEYSVEAGTEYYTNNDMFVCLDDNSGAAFDCVALGYREWVLWFADFTCPNQAKYDLKLDWAGTGSNMYYYTGMWAEELCRNPPRNPGDHLTGNPPKEPIGGVTGG